MEPFISGRGEHAHGAVAALSVVEDLQVPEDRVGEFDADAPPPAVEQLGLHSPQNDSIMRCLTVIDGPHRWARPAPWTRWVKAHDVNSLREGRDDAAALSRSGDTRVTSMITEATRS